MPALFCGDNLDILRRYLVDESVDLPFNSTQKRQATSWAADETFKAAPRAKMK